MNLPKLDMDRSWAYAGWPESLVSTIENGKKKARSTGFSLLKQFITSDWLKKRTVDKFVSDLKMEEIGDNTYRISNDYVFQSYLLVGKQKALLIDTGLGVGGNLLEIVKGITDKPLTVICTHGHFGVVGGAGQFDEVQIDKADLRMAKLMNLAVRKITGQEKVPNFVPIDKKVYKDGIDLGGRTIKVELLPSHTKGSVCFTDDKFAITGDTMGPLGIQLLPGSVPINRYAEVLDKYFRDLSTKKIYCSYFPRSIDYSRVSEFKDLLYSASMQSANYASFICFKHSSSKKQFLIYYGAKSNQREFKSRFVGYKPFAK